MKYTITSILLLTSATTFAQTNTFPTTGNIGIGTTSPTDLLNIQTGNQRRGVTIQGDGDLEVYSDISFYMNKPEIMTNGKPISWLISYRKDGHFSGSAEGLSMEFYAIKKGGGYFAPLSFKPDGDVILASPQQAHSGNVGIGTVSPQEKLSVNGRIRAHEIKVETANWPDYVFKPEYQLPSLTETEQFIKENGHLPEIPKASEIESDGIPLGKMNTLLLKKIEELTLHLIEKDKEIIEINKVLKKLVQDK